MLNVRLDYTLRGKVSSNDAPWTGTGTWYLPTGLTLSDVIAAYQSLKAPSELKSRTDIASGTYPLTIVGTPKWDVNGWYYSGGNYYKTGIVPTANMSALFFMKVLRNHSVMSHWLGVVDTTSFGLLSNETNYCKFIYGTNIVSSGISAYNENNVSYGIAGAKGYRNGVDLSITLDNAYTGTTHDIWMLRHNNGGSPGGTLYFDTSRLSAAVFYNKVISTDQMLEIHQALVAI